MIRFNRKIVFSLFSIFILVNPIFLSITFTNQYSIPSISQTNIDTLLNNLTSNFNTRRAGTLEGNQSAEFIYSYLTSLNLTAEYEYFFTQEEGYLINVIVEFPGNSSDDFIVLGAHYDTINFSNKYAPAPGANDNGASVALLLEVSRILGNYTFNKGIKIIFFGGEEIGRYGSLNWIQNNSEYLDNIIVALVLDMVAYDDNLIIDFNQPSKWIADYIYDRISVPNLNFAIEENYYLSDQTRFWDAGITSLLIHHDNPLSYSYIHTSQDTMDKLNMSMVYLTAQLVLDIIFNISNDESINPRNGNGIDVIFIAIAITIIGAVIISVVIYSKKISKKDK